MNHPSQYVLAALFGSLALVLSALTFHLSPTLASSKPWEPVLSYIRPVFNIAPSFFDEENVVTKPIADPNQITANAYVVSNINSGEVYMEKNSSTVFPVASMSKLITAIAATDMFKRDMVVEVKQTEYELPPDHSNLIVGEKMTLEEMLYPMLLSSSNIAAESISRSKDRGEFLESMSSYAWEIGMPSAYFADPSGIDPHNAASARDIFALAQYLYKFRPDVLSITRINTFDLATTTDHGSHSIHNIHPFVMDENFLGGKTGRTPEAGETMLTILNIGEEPIAFVVLKSDLGQREADTRKLVRKYKSLMGLE